jgi:hypothetical protein
MKDAKEELLERQQAHVKALFKSLLMEFESIKDDHDERYQLLQDQLGPEHLPMLIAANPLTDNKSLRIRKKILDIGNDILRAMDSEANKYLVSFVFKQPN